jgi:hypothetical protein
VSDVAVVAAASRRAGPLVLGVAFVAGIVAAMGGAAPTGQQSIDTVMIGIAVALTTWWAASAPRWLTAWAALVAGVLSMSILGCLLGFGAFALGLWPFGNPVLDRFDRQVVSASLAGLALNLAAVSRLELFLGASTVAAMMIGLALAIGGAALRNGRQRRVLLALTGIVLAVAVAASVAFALTAFSSIDDLSKGNETARAGLRLLGDGEITAARDAFEQSAEHFDRAEGRLGSPLGIAAGAVPVVAQHRRAALTLSTEAADALALIDLELASVDIDSFRIVDGGVDIEEVSALLPPLVAIQNRIEELDRSVEQVGNQWLVPALETRLARLRSDIDEQRQRGENAIELVTLVPNILGADGPRTYYVAFTTPAEARGLGGFTGNFAELSVTDGRLELTDFGRSDALDNVVPAGTRRLDGPEEWLRQYGPIGFDNWPGRTVGPDPFKNVTVSPVMESTGNVIAQLYPQSGGVEVDGVIAMDVRVLAQLLEFTGPIDLDAAGRSLDQWNATRFLLNEQYQLTDIDERTDLIEDASRRVVDELLTGALPPPLDIVAALGPLVEEGRLLAWMADRDEQAMVERAGLAGTLPDATSVPVDDAVAVVYNNAIGNKIDYYLESSVSYSGAVNLTEGTVTSQLDITLTNTAPSDGQPIYVIGNPLDEAIGTNRTWVSAFGGFDASAVLLDGQPVASTSGIEAGYRTTSVVVRLSAGESRVVTMRFTGTFDASDGYALLVRSPPTANPVSVLVDLDVHEDGETKRVSERRDRAGITVLSLPD